MTRKIAFVALMVFTLAATTAMAGNRPVAQKPTAASCCPQGDCCGPSCDTTGCN